MNKSQTPKPGSQQQEVRLLREQYKDAVQKYNKLPRRESFSGWHYLDIIESCERKLAELGAEVA